jgi:hypothetical protein
MKENGFLNYGLNDELHEEVYHKTKESFYEIKNEFKKQTTIAITAALAFLIALSWKEPIYSSFLLLIDKLNLNLNEIYVQYLSAILITFLGVLILILLNKLGVIGPLLHRRARGKSRKKVK